MVLPALALAAAAEMAAPPEKLAAEAAVAEGEHHYARRAEGAPGPTADPAEVQAAIAHYRRGRALDPDSIPARIGLLRALFFRGGFCGEKGAAQKSTFEDAKVLAEESMRRLDARATALTAPSRIEALRLIPGAAPLLFWSAVAWGQWSLDHKVAAAWQGAARRIRDLGETAIALDPAYEQGSPYLVLGRLHAESPRIPFLTGWISRKKAIENLRRAWEISPENTVAQYFLAKAILDHDPRRSAEALRLLGACAAQEPRARYIVEDRHYSELSRALSSLTGRDSQP